MERIPFDVQFVIIQDFSPLQLCKFSCVCKSWNKILQNDSLWKKLCIYHFEISKLLSSTWKDTFQMLYGLYFRIGSKASSLKIENRTITGIEGNFCNVWGDVIWNSGKHDFEVRLENLTTINLAFGVADPTESPNEHLSKFAGNFIRGYVYSAYHGGVECTKCNNRSAFSYGPAGHSGDIIGVHLDLDVGTLSFSMNNSIDLGICFHDLKGPLSPVITLYKGSSVTLHPNLNWH